MYILKTSVFVLFLFFSSYCITIVVNNAIIKTKAAYSYVLKAALYIFFVPDPSFYYSEDSASVKNRRCNLSSFAIRSSSAFTDSLFVRAMCFS